jgi:hypothetical protein
VEKSARFFAASTEASPVLVLDGDGDVPVVGMFRNRIGIELIVNHPTLLLKLIVDRPEILAEVAPVLVAHAVLTFTYMTRQTGPLL